MIEMEADASHKMQEFLKIIEDICNGLLDPKQLAKHRHYNCRKSKQEIANALVSKEREDYIFGLNQEFERHHFYMQQIQKCDQQISKFLHHLLKDSALGCQDDKPLKEITRTPAMVLI